METTAAEAKVLNVRLQTWTWSSTRPGGTTANEVQFGMDWHVAHGRQYELTWVADTGDIDAMQDNLAAVWWGHIRPCRDGIDP